MNYGWVSSRGGKGLDVRPIEITGKVGSILVQTSCSEDEFERTLEGEAFIRMVIIAFVIGAIRLPRSDYNWERDAPYGVYLNVRVESEESSVGWILRWIEPVGGIVRGIPSAPMGAGAHRLLDSVYFCRQLGDYVRFPTFGGGFLVPGRERVTVSGGEVGRLSIVDGVEIGRLRCWPGGLCLLRSIGDMDVGEFIVPVPYVKQVKEALRSRGLKDDTTCIVADIIPPDNSLPPSPL
ncbi:hypothetical protein GIB67_001895 [Kingdonia uniflora]|uniref:Uncharacterized protein n=1 Tax=Kingdonia uniflora TaxID=39325 RepID=A0A7J7LQU3_9MAGN|nr:hypothetical protein GIB67_001895 [Kingdonia uniflora]